MEITDCTRRSFRNEWKKKLGVLAFQKVAKTGNIGKKSPVAGNIDYVSYLSMQKVKNQEKALNLHLTLLQRILVNNLTAVLWDSDIICVSGTISGKMLQKISCYVSELLFL